VPGTGMEEPGSGGTSSPGIFGTGIDEPGSGGTSSPGIFGTGIDEPGKTGTAAGAGSPERWKEPIGGGPWETGGATTKAGCAARVPGGGGAITGVAI